MHTYRLFLFPQFQHHRIIQRILLLLFLGELASISANVSFLGARILQILIGGVGLSVAKQPRLSRQPLLCQLPLLRLNLICSFIKILRQYLILLQISDVTDTIIGQRLVLDLLVLFLEVSPRRIRLIHLPLLLLDVVDELLNVTHRIILSLLVLLAPRTVNIRVLLARQIPNNSAQLGRHIPVRLIHLEGTHVLRKLPEAHEVFVLVVAEGPDRRIRSLSRCLGRRSHLLFLLQALGLLLSHLN